MDERTKETVRALLDRHPRGCVAESARAVAVTAGSPVRRARLVRPPRPSP